MRLVIALILLCTLLNESTLSKPAKKPRYVTRCARPFACPFPAARGEDRSTHSSSSSSSSGSSSDGSSDEEDSESESDSTSGTNSSETSSSCSSCSSDGSSDESEDSSDESEDCSDGSCSSSEDGSESDESSEEDSDSSHQGVRFQGLSGHGEDVESVPLIGYESIFMDFVAFEESLNRPLTYHYKIHKGAFNRERARIIETSLNANSPSIINKSIRKWVSLGNKAAGLGTYSMAFVRLADENLQVSYKDILAEDADLFEWWDGEEMTLKVGLIVAQDARVDWYQLLDDMELLQTWSWSMVDPISNVNIFKFDNQWKILIVSEPHNNYNGGSKITTLYGMDLFQNWWLEQTLLGDGGPIVTRDAKHIVTFSNILERVFIYRYSDHLGRYVLHQNISDSTEINDIATFDIGYTCFIAVASGNSAIYRIHNDKLVLCHVENFHLDHVERWLPMPVDYLRDDAIILLQQKLNHFSHASTVVEALVWNGETFELLEGAPCYANGDEHHGLSCISLETSDRGLIGATILTEENGSATLISNKIFDIRSEIVAVPNPAEERTDHVLNTMKMLQTKYREQEEEIKKLQNIIKTAPSLSGSHWHIQELRVPFVHFDGVLDDFLMQNSKFQINGQSFSKEYPEETISFYKNILQNQRVRIKNAISHLKGSVNKSDISKLEPHLIVTGKFEVKGGLHIVNARVEQINDVNANDVLERATMLKTNSRSNALELDFLNVEHIIVDGYFNGVKFPGADSNDQVILNRNLILDKPLMVLENVNIQPNGLLNNISLNKDIIDVSRSYSNITKMSFENIIITKSLEVNGSIKCKNNAECMNIYNRNHDENDSVTLDSLSATNVEVNFVNGIPWERFIKNVVYTNVNNTIDNLEVDGDVISAGSVDVKHLNGVAFPGDYVLRNGARAIHITAKKSFRNTIEASGVDAVGEINGIRPERIVTLSTAQELGDVTFTDLTVTGKMDIKEKVSIKGMETFLNNPTLMETSKINSNVIFNDITVRGKVFVTEGVTGSQ